MADINRFTVTGRTTKEPETRQVGEYTICEFSVANGVYRKNEEDNQKTSFIDCQVWNKVADIFKTLPKGTPLTLSGEMVQSRYKDKEGKNRSSWTLEVRDFVIHRQGEKTQQESKKVDDPFQEDDIPF